MWQQNDELLDLCTIQIQSIKILTNDIFLNSHYETLMLDQLKDYCSLTYSNSKLRKYLQIKQSQENPSVEFQQSLSQIVLEQPSIDQLKQIKFKEIATLNEINLSKTQRARIKTLSFQTTQNEILQNNEPECLQIENTANNIFSMSTFYSPRHNTLGEQQFILQSTARTSEKEIAYQINSKNNLLSMQNMQKHNVVREKQNSIEDTDSENEQSQSLKEEKQNKSSVLETLNQISSQQKSLPQNLQSVSTSINSSYKVEKLQIYNTFKSINKPLLFLVIRNISIICLVTLLIFILVVFINLRTSFQLNTKNFYYISWGNNLRAERSKCLKSIFVQMILSNPLYGYSSDPNLNLYQSQILSNAAQSYNQYQQFITQLTHEKMEELNFMQILFEQYSTVFYYSLQKQANITSSGIYTLLMDFQSVFQLLIMQQYNPLTEYSVYSRFSSIASLLALIQQSQQQSVLDTFNQIYFILVILLIVMVIICTLFVIVVFPAYAFCQNYKQQIYTLFSAIDITQIREIHKNLNQSLLIICDKNTTLQQSYRKYQNSGILNKKKSISSTTKLKKFSIKIFICTTIFYIILMIYPVINLIITNNLINQQNSNQDLQGAILTTKAAFVSIITTYSLYANSALNPNKNNFQAQYSQKYKQLAQLAQQSYQNLTQIVQKQDLIQRYDQDNYNKFVFQILEKDACNPIFNNPQLVYKNLTNFNEITCKQLIDGQLSNGLLNSLSYFLNIMNNIFILHLDKESISKQQELSNYLQKYRLLDLNMASEYLQTVQDILNNFIYSNISDFFSYMNNIQIALLIYQFIVLIIANYLAFFVFFKSISRSMNQAKNSLTIIQMKYIIESPYIMSFVKKQQQI
ncbi:transmembrane protein, putative (macronuclear) [Tetrahymena thermophila SB210]|uniref:Transmembrane protein, putative n=1 Tax=Tetrahymena thermophila (strain SB210) TaxID=312017 RepID=Q22P54_TETTS|nr:transmembrane protein, putative [Tetrahymena thermophila SB210]EAR86957.2 transmembrane protein, putative [Tetrahymena thermophila SB210]|eukprot:XP_001007202.2 transmembrane protein, putative [Tetrahymena thermophila SB210]